MSIKTGQLLNKINLNAAFMSKLESNNILGDLTTQGNITTVGTASVGTNLSVGGALTVVGKINTATISGGTVSGGSLTGGTWDATKSAYLNQAVLTTSSPTFAGLTIAAGVSPRVTINAPTNAGPTISLGRLAGNSSIKSTETWLMLDGSSTNGHVGLSYYTSGNVSLAKGGGSVAIGMDTPTKKLDVSGDIRLTGQLFSPTELSLYTDTSTAQSLKVGQLVVSSSYSNNATANGLYVAGDTGLGIAATQKLHVGGNTLTTGKTMIGNVSTYFDLAATNIIHTPNDMQIDKNLYMNTNSSFLYFGNTNTIVLRHGGDSILQLGQPGTGGGINNFYVQNGYISISTTNVSEKLNVGGNAYVEGTVKYKDENKYLLMTKANTGLYYNSTSNFMEFHGAGVKRAHISLVDGTSHFTNTMNLAKNLIASENITSQTLTVGASGTTNLGGIDVIVPLGGDGMWNRGITITNTNANTGEAALSFKNAGATGTGTNSWIMGLDQNTDLSFTYGTDFTGTPKMKVTNAGAFTVDGELYSKQHKVWHAGNLEAAEVRREEFTATHLQKVFTLTTGPMPLNRNLLSVYIWGVKQPPTAYTETTATTFTLIQGVASGTKVLAEWYEISYHLRGETGESPEFQWSSTSLRFKNPDRSWGTYVDLKGNKGDLPAHEWNGTTIRFQNPNATWGGYTDLRGIQGIPGIAAKINLGTVTFLEPNGTGYITNAGNTTDATFNIGIPKGSTVALHSTPVTVLNPTQNPTITNSGTNGNSILKFGIPRAANLSFHGTPITVLNPNQSPTVTNSGTNGDVVMKLGLPRAPSVSIGTVTTLAPGVNGAITNTGSNGDAVFNFDLPTGKGITNVINNLNGTVTMQYGENKSTTVSLASTYVVKRQEFIANEGQTLFNITNGTYTVGGNRLSVYIWGIKQYNVAYTETSNKSFTMASPLELGDRVIAEWIAAADIDSMYGTHSATHAIGGGDEITAAMIGAEVSVTSKTKPTNATMWYEEV